MLCGALFEYAEHSVIEDRSIASFFFAPEEPARMLPPTRLLLLSHTNLHLANRWTVKIRMIFRASHESRFDRIHDDVPQLLAVVLLVADNVIVVLVQKDLNGISNSERVARSEE